MTVVLNIHKSMFFNNFSVLYKNIIFTIVITQSLNSLNYEKFNPYLLNLQPNDNGIFGTDHSRIFIQ
jgi:hypothetical protein